jgi:Flp pilus assembly protein TadB
MTTPTTATELAGLAAFAGACAAGAVICTLLGLLPPTGPAQSRPAPRWRSALRAVADPARRNRLVAAVTIGMVTLLVLGWPVAAIAAAAGIYALPRLLSGREPRRRITRLEALEQWARRLAEVLAASRGLEQTLIDSIRITPEAIRGEVSVLARRLANRADTEQALRGFAADLDDPIGDLIATALILAARRRGPGTRNALAALADAVAHEVNLRREVDAERAALRTTLTVIVISVVGLSVLFMTARTLAAPFGTPLGQLVLAAVTGLYAAGLAWMHHLTQITTGTRLLHTKSTTPIPTGHTEPAPSHPAGAAP